MEEQVLFNQIKALIEKEFKGIKAENNNLKKENQEIKETFAKLCQLCKADSECLSLNGIEDKKQPVEYKLIDLGLPSGTLWMDRNVGATSPTDSGLYFAWGETKGYTADEVGKNKQFSWTDYKYANGAYTKLTKYCNKSIYGNLVTLQTADDAAYQFTNGKCSMPTTEQIQELIYNTTFGYTTMDGVDGALFTSKTNSNSIFVPAAGSCAYGSVYELGENGGLWSSSLCESLSNYACYLNFGGEVVGCTMDSRCEGYSVRGVKY